MNKTQQQQTTWRTDDIALAAYLRYLDYPLEELEWDLNSCFFLFKRTDKLIADVQDFVSDEALVIPRRYSMVFGQLKKAMFEDHPNPPRRRKR